MKNPLCLVDARGKANVEEGRLSLDDRLGWHSFAGIRAQRSNAGNTSRRARLSSAFPRFTLGARHALFVVAYLASFGIIGLMSWA